MGFLHARMPEENPCLPLGEGAAPAADEGRYRVGLCTAPHPSRLRRSTLSQERVM